jgi:hypothetical protein
VLPVCVGLLVEQKRELYFVSLQRLASVWAGHRVSVCAVTLCTAAELIKWWDARDSLHDARTWTSDAVRARCQLPDAVAGIAASGGRGCDGGALEMMLELGRSTRRSRVSGEGRRT